MTKKKNKESITVITAIAPGNDEFRDDFPKSEAKYVAFLDAHNKLHAHQAWNKGKKWNKKTIEKIKLSRFKYYLPKFKEAFELQSSGKKLREIAEIQKISRRQVSDRILNYKHYLN